MQSLGVNVTKDEIRSWVAVGKDGSSDIVDFYAFSRMAASKLVQHERSQKAFDLFDKDGKGVVCFEDLQRVAQDLGESMTDEDLQEMIEEADRNSQGFVDHEDFMHLARNINL